MSRVRESHKARDLLSTVIARAVVLHAGQKDLQGRTYILHPLRVMAAMDTDAERMVAVLHDTWEDCGGPSTTADLPLPPEVLAGLTAMTQGDDEPYVAYVERLAKDPIARKVKVADIRDNLRLAPETPKIHRLRSKYAWALSYLLGPTWASLVPEAAGIPAIAPVGDRGSVPA